jgi:hypothetical protein
LFSIILVFPPPFLALAKLQAGLLRILENIKSNTLDLRRQAEMLEIVLRLRLWSKGYRTVTNSERNKEMTHRKHGFGVIGICLVAALGLMAFAASAQAKGTWRHNNAGAITTSPSTIVGEKDSAEFVLKSKSGLTAIEVLCKKLVISEGKLLLEGKSTGKLEFSECQFLGKGMVLGECKPLEPIIAKVKDLLFKHLANGKTYDLFSPEDGTLNFTTLHLGEGCAFGQMVPITGHAVIEGCKPTTPENEANGLETEVVKHLIQQAPENTALWTGSFKNGLFYEGNAATITGSEWLKLDPAGPLAGQTWSGVGITED